eukprot:8073453-Alexandrium_andersonii.AAC.1
MPPAGAAQQRGQRTEQAMCNFPQPHSTSTCGRVTQACQEYKSPVGPATNAPCNKTAARQAGPAENGGRGSGVP